MKILTIIVSYNFERWMKPCLESLTRSVHPTDVLVIDNGSTDRTVSLLRESYPWVRLIANGENLGFGRANNIGLRLALDEGYDAAFRCVGQSRCARHFGRTGRAASGVRHPLACASERGWKRAG